MIKIIKKLLLFLLVIFLTNSCSSNLKYLTPYDGHNGKPKRTESTSYAVNYKNNKKIIDTFYTNVSIFDKKGRQTEQQSIKNGEKLPRSGMSLKYDKFGNNIKVNLKNSKGITYKINNFLYNKFGQQIRGEYLRYIEDTLHSKSYTYTTYYRKKREDSIIYKSTRIKEAEYLFRKYDSKWREIETRYLNSSGLLNKKHVHKYDKFGNQIMTKKYNSENHLISFSLRIFNTSNDLTSIISYKVKDQDTIKIKEEEYLNKYDLKGNNVESKTFVDGFLSFIRKTKYVY